MTRLSPKDKNYWSFWVKLIVISVILLAGYFGLIKVFEPPEGYGIGGVVLLVPVQIYFMVVAAMALKHYINKK